MMTTKTGKHDWLKKAWVPSNQPTTDIQTCRTYCLPKKEQVKKQSNIVCGSYSNFLHKTVLSWWWWWWWFHSRPPRVACQSFFTKIVGFGSSQHNLMCGKEEEKEESAKNAHYTLYCTANCTYMCARTYFSIECLQQAARVTGWLIWK